MNDTTRKQSVSKRKSWKFWLLFVVTPIMVILCSLLGAYGLYKMKQLSGKQGANKGQIYLSLGKNKDAIDVFKKELTKNPENADIHYYMGIAYFRLKEYDKAIDKFKTALKIKPDYPDAHLPLSAANFQIALELRKLGENETAVLERLLESEAVCEDFLKSSPDSVRAHLQLGDIHLAMGFIEDAIIDYNDALKLDNSRLPAHVALIKLYMRQGNIDLIEKQCKDTLEVDNSLIPVHIELVKLHLKRGDNDLAIKKCKIVLSDINPDNYPVLLLLSAIYENQGKVDEAAACLNRILEKKPEDVTAHVRLGLINLKMSKYDEALFEAEQTYLTDSVAIPPAVNFIKGSVLLQKKDYKNAEEEFSKLLQSNYAFDGYLNMAKVNLAQRNYDKCIEHCKSGLEVKPEDIRIRHIMGIAYMKKGLLNKAMFEFNNILNSHPDFIPANLDLAAIKRKLNQPSVAALLYKKVLKLKPDLVKARMGLGNAYFLMKKEEDAVAEFDIVEQRYAENNVGIYLSLARNHMSMGKDDKAEELIITALDLAPNNAKLNISIANIYIAFGKYDKAKELLKKALNLEPKNPVANSLLASIHIRNEDISKAIMQLRLALLDNPKFIDLYKLGGLYIGEGEYDDAVLIYKKGVKNFPNNVSLWCNLSIAYLMQEDYKGAEEACSEALKIKASGIIPNLCMVNTLMAQGDFASAKQNLKNIAKFKDLQQSRYNDLIEFCDNNRELANKVVYHSSRAMVYSSNKWLKRTLKEYEEIIKIAPSNAVAYQELADINIMSRTGDKGKAIDALKKIIELEPESIAPYFKLASIYARKGEKDKEEEQYRNIIMFAPDNVAAHLKLGGIFQSKDLIKESEQAYKRAIELDPSSVGAYNNLAWLMATQMQGKMEEAFKLAKKAKELRPDISSVIGTLGWIYYLDGMYDKAVSELETAIKIGPWNPTIRYHLGMAYYKNGQQDLALNELERALEINNSFSEAKETSELIKEIKKVIN